MSEPTTAKVAPTPADDDPRRNRRPGTLAVGLVLLLLVLVAAEGATRYLEPALYGRDAGNAPEAVRKADRMEALSPEAPQVVAVGDSSLDAGFDPGAFSASSTTFSSAYNASLVGSRVPTQQLWNEQQVLPDLHPKLVVQGLSPTLTLRIDDAIDPAVFDSVLNQSVRSLDDSFGQRVERTVSSWSAVVRNRSSLRSPREIWEALGRRLRGDKAPVSATNPPGYWERYLAPDGQNEAYAKGVLGTTTPGGLVPLLQQLVDGDQDLQPVDALMRSYREADVPVVVVIPPVALDVLDASGVSAAKWRQATSALADHLRAQGVAVVDMTDAGYDRTLFFDPLHLNGDGAQRFSTELAQRVDELCRSDSSLGCGA